MKTIPKLGFGTFRMEGNVAYQSVKTSLEVGYRHIDTAQIYGNEAEVGQAIADSGVSRETLFVTTKVWLDNLPTERFISSVHESLVKLQLDHVDLLLIHWPDIKDNVPMETYLKSLKHTQDSGLCTHIGVSNFTNAQLDQAIEILGQGSLFTNQVEVHPYLQNRAVINHCQDKQILVTGFMPLAVGKVMTDSVLQSIASQHQVSIAEVVIAWQLQQGLVTIPSSTKQRNQEINLKSLTLTLSDDEMTKIATLDQGERIADPDFAPLWD